MARNMYFCVRVLFLLCISSLLTHAQNNHRAAWMHDAGWGVFTHYLSDLALAGTEPSPEAWNAVVDKFDVNGLVDQLVSIDAKYYVITLGQNSGYYISPNATYDKIVGYQPSRCSTRDLIADIAAALKPKGIRLMVYLPGGAPDRDTVAMEKLKWKNGKYPIWSHPNGGPDGGDDRLVEFQRMWEAVIGEWSQRWGENVSGWWFDGCYFPIAMYLHSDAPNFESFAAAARSGNPNSIVAFNPGVRNPIRPATPAEDYTAGEIDAAEAVACDGRFIEGIQFHMLSYIGTFWAKDPPRYSMEQLRDLTARIVEKDGAVTWDVPILPSGLIPEPYIERLSGLKDLRR